MRHSLNSYGAVVLPAMGYNLNSYKLIAISEKKDLYEPYENLPSARGPDG
jgi:hypothetical protein